ncbi:MULTISPECIES: LPXTG cell wall anchor domain-containing protein [unclassified Jeotgalibaca]
MDKEIIGGADGATEMFVSSPVNWFLIAGIVTVAVGLILWVVGRNKK